MNSRQIWGLILVVIGGLFLLRNLDIIDYSWRHVEDYWPVVLIIVGAVLILRYIRQDSRPETPPVIGNAENTPGTGH